MGQMYLQRLSTRGRPERLARRGMEQGLQAFARSGLGDVVDGGVRHRHSYGTGWAGHALIG